MKVTPQVAAGLLVALAVAFYMGRLSVQSQQIGGSAEQHNSQSLTAANSYLRGTINTLKSRIAELESGDAPAGMPPGGEDGGARGGGKEEAGNGCPEAEPCNCGSAGEQSSLSAADGAQSSPQDPPAGGSGKKRSFKEIGDSHKDDKTRKHRYHIGYSAYLEQHRDKPLAMMEIGLGCDQPDGIGASVLLWEEYLPQASLTMLEYDKKCGEKWLATHSNRGPKGGLSFYYGDQADEKVLQAVLDGESKKLGSGKRKQFDLIVDDGGHQMHQQLAAFKVLWPAVKRGGVYVIEDINTSFKTRYGGTRRPNCTGATATNLVKELMDKVHALPVKGHPGKYMEDIEFRSPVARVDCMHFICFITKR